jgi:hypothetical protein
LKHAARCAKLYVVLAAGDKLYEKRKLGALEVEQIVKRLAQQNDYHRIRLIIDKVPSNALQQGSLYTLTITWAKHAGGVARADTM